MTLPRRPTGVPTTNPPKPPPTTKQRVSTVASDIRVRVYVYSMLTVGLVIGSWVVTDWRLAVLGWFGLFAGSAVTFAAMRVR